MMNHRYKVAATDCIAEMFDTNRCILTEIADGVRMIERRIEIFGRLADSESGPAPSGSGP